MQDDTMANVAKSVRMGLFIAGAVSLTVAALAWFQVEAERQIDMDDLVRRAQILAHQLTPRIQDELSQSDAQLAGALGTRLDGYRKLIGYAVYRPDGRLAAAGKGIPDYADVLKQPVTQTIAEKREVSEPGDSQGIPLHILATPIRDDAQVLQGVLVTVHDVSHLEDRANGRLVRYGFWILIVTVILTTTVLQTIRAAYERPLQKLADWMRRVRIYNALDAPPAGLPSALLSSESDRLAVSFRAARAARTDESRALVRSDKHWTRERLRDHSVDCLHGGQLVVVSNREPYMHQLRDGRPQMIVPAGGLVTALDPILQSCGGVWVAHGSGDADHETVDECGRLSVPPHDPRYTLRRVWLNREEEQGYYYGFANEGLWPLCHLAHERPIFRASDWQQYVQVNRRFANAVLEEIDAEKAVVLVQDYQLALVPRMLKAVRPELTVGIFWHIPWPNAEAFRICPWRAEILHGMLGADLVGFHLQQFCNNFLETVDRMVEARLDWDHFAIELKGHTSLIRPFPISVESWSERGVPAGKELAQQIAELKDRHSLEEVQIAVGVDRVDYTKGLPERLRAIARFLEKYPQHRGKFTFVQLGAPSRTHIPRYRELITELERLTDEINWKFQTDRWKPIHLLIAHHDVNTVHAFLRMASVCIVSSLHDGMNLVAKEFVAAKEQGEGMLILSEFAGAARELSDALIVNPYDLEQCADAIHYAVEMGQEERFDRMTRMQRAVEENNVYRWAANFLTELTGVRVQQPATSDYVEAGHADTFGRHSGMMNSDAV